MKLINLHYKRNQFSLGPINFAFEKTGLYFIQGRNGAGKTSLIRLLMGRIKNFEGKIDERPTSCLYLGAEGFFFSEWTCLENWNYFSRLQSQKQAFPYAASSYQNRRLKDLSLGQRKKMEFLMLLEWNSPALLIDEGFTHLDGPTKDEMQMALAKKSQDSLVICSIHESTEVFGSQKGAISL